MPSYTVHIHFYWSFILCDPRDCATLCGNLDVMVKVHVLSLIYSRITGGFIKIFLCKLFAMQSQRRISHGTCIMGKEARSKINIFRILYVLGKQLSLKWTGHIVWMPHPLFNTSMVSNHLWSIAGSKELNNPSQHYGPKTTLNNLPDENRGPC